MDHVGSAVDGVDMRAVSVAMLRGTWPFEAAILVAAGLGGGGAAAVTVCLCLSQVSYNVRACCRCLPCWMILEVGDKVTVECDREETNEDVDELGWLHSLASSNCLGLLQLLYLRKLTHGLPAWLGMDWQFSCSRHSLTLLAHRSALSLHTQSLSLSRSLT